MSKMFCLSCNGCTEYSSSKPKFCSKCGKPYISESNAATAIPDVKKPTFTLSSDRQKPIISENGEDITGDATYVPKIDKIECQFNVADLRPNRQMAERVFAEGAQGVDRDFVPRPKPQKVKRLSKSEKQREIENIKNQFKNELAGSSRNTRQSTEIGE